jgi:hypothetical protein
MDSFDNHQRIYRRHDLPIADYLLGFQQALRDEFLSNCGIDELEKIATNTQPTLSSRGDIPQDVLNYLVQNKESTPNLSLWKSRGLKYTNEDSNVKWQEQDPAVVEKYPTAFKLIKEFGDDCPFVFYSLLGPNSKINRHTGIENRKGESVRIHIPLIVPEGDLYLEVLGEIVRWDDIFAFNNQFVHSAHNNTDKWRLCFLIDIQRTRAGLPPGVHYSQIKHLDDSDQQFGEYVSGSH